MASVSLIDQLDDAIEVLLAGPDSGPPRVDLGISELVDVAAELRSLPSSKFKARLKADLLEQVFARSLETPRRVHVKEFPAPKERKSKDSLDVLPTLFSDSGVFSPVHRASFAASFLAHSAALALVISSAAWFSQHGLTRIQKAEVLTELSPYVLPAAAKKAGGGGGGGDHDKLEASKGTPPPFTREQIVPPSILVRNESPKLSADASVIGPPSLNVTEKGAIGDPLSAILGPSSNGTGSGGGIGSGEGGGVGAGMGPGVGPGYGGGIGGGVYRVGGGVSAPRAFYSPDPEYSEEARKAKFQGTVVLWTIIGPDGRPRNIRVARTLGMGLDEKAIEAVRHWRFEPAMKDGHPVAVQVNIEVSFRLY